MNSESTNLYHLPVDVLSIITYQNGIFDSLSLFAINKKTRELKFHSYIWKKFLEIHFPHFYANLKNDEINHEPWFFALKAAYSHDYSCLTPTDRSFFSTIKQGIFINFASLQIESLIHTVDGQGHSLSYWISRANNQALADGLYHWIEKENTSNLLNKVKIYLKLENQGLRLLHWACILNQPLVTVESHLKVDSVNVQDPYQKTPLMYAVKNAHIRIVQFLLEKNADVNIDTKDNWNALSFAVAQHSMELVTLLTNNMRRFSHPMTVAISYGYLDIYQALLAKKGGFIGENDLITAVHHDQYEMVEFLLNKNALVNHSTEDRYTALMIALLNNRTHIAELLIIRGAKVLLKNKLKETALDIARQRCITLLPLLNRFAIAEYITEWDRTHREPFVQNTSFKAEHFEFFNSFFNGIPNAKKRVAAGLLKEVLEGRKEMSLLKSYPFERDKSELGRIYKSFIEVQKAQFKHHTSSSSSKERSYNLN